MEYFCPEGHHLAFSYLKNGSLQCQCQQAPHYSSIHIERDLCPEQHCENETYVLDLDEDTEQCICRPHPCTAEDEEEPLCKEPTHPILVYREELSETGEVKIICECLSA